MTIGSLEAQLPEQAAAAQPRTTTIDATTDPAAFNEASAAAAGTESGPSFEHPVIPMPEDTTVVLPAGILLPDGRLVTTVEVREMTGEDEEALSKFRNLKPAAYVGELVLRGLADIDGELATKATLATMLVGDRDTILLGIRRVTFGNEIEFPTNECPECASEFDIKVECTEIELRKLPDPTVRTITVPLRRKDSVAVLRWPNHSDVVAMWDNEKMTPAERNTALLARCFVSINGMDNEDVSFDPWVIARKLGSGDRSKILKAMTQSQPGPLTGEVKANCPACNFEARVEIDLVSIFRA